MDNKLLRANDVAERLNISLGQAFVLIREGALPSVRFGRTIRIRREDLEMFIANQLLADPETILKAKLAAATASLENTQVTDSEKEVSHER